jgi:hypothetical protein
LPLARLCVRVFGWTRTVAVWQQCQRAGSGTVGEEEADKIVKAVDEAVSRAAAKYPFQVACKERALCCWALVGSTGVPATLVVGINLFPLCAHCWCESGLWTPGDDPDHCKRYVPVVRYKWPAGSTRL